MFWKGDGYSTQNNHGGGTQESGCVQRVINLINVFVIRRLFDEGWTNENVALAYTNIQNETGRVVLAHAMPGWKYVDETKAAAEVYASVTRSE